MMQVFPFKKNILILNESECDLTKSQRFDILKKINTPKPYKLFWHFNQFLKNNGTDEHYYSTVPTENRISYNTKLIKYHSIDSITKSLRQKETSWDVFYKELQKGLIEKNTYEQLLFETDCKKVSFIPIPVLSTPSIILVLNNKYLDTNKKALLKSLYFRSRDTVDSYLYARLLDSLIFHLEVSGERWNEEQLVEAFVKEICNIILPISYRINEDNVKEYYMNWPSNGFKSEYILPLLDGRYRVIFNLTSFHYVDLDNIGNSEWAWIHSSKIYESNCNQSSLLLCKLFKLLHSNWKLTRSAEERAYAKIAQTISHIDIKGLKKNVENLEKDFEEIRKHKNELEITTPANCLLIENEKIHLIIDGEDLIIPSDCTGVNQQSGFIYLNYILKRSRESDYKIRIKYDDLYNNVDVPKKENLNPDFLTEKNNTLKRLQADGNEIRETLVSFYDSHKDEIYHCLNNNCISKNKSFNESFYHNAKVLIEYNNNKVYKYINFKGDNTPLIELGKLIKLYIRKDRLNTLSQIKEKDVNNYFENIRSSKYIIEKDNYGINQKNFIREGFKAMIKLLRNNQKKSTGKKQEAFKRLLLNLEVAGLIKTDKDEPSSQITYKYNQRNIHPFIDWDI